MDKKAKQQARERKIVLKALQVNFKYGQPQKNNLTALSTETGIKYERTKNILDNLARRGKLLQASGIYYVI